VTLLRCSLFQNGKGKEHLVACVNERCEVENDVCVINGLQGLRQWDTVQEAGSEDSGGHSGDEEERKQPPDTEGAGKSSGRHEGRKVGNQGRVRVPRRRRKQGK
jgi:hypothetical protein